jgi:hypothetical protein
MMDKLDYLSFGATFIGLVDNHALPLYPFSLDKPFSISSSTNTYDPFSSDIYIFIPYLSTLFIALTLVSNVSSSAYRWLPKSITGFIASLSPFISEDDLKTQRGLDRKAFLRRGAVHAEDNDSEEYSNKGFIRQANRNAVISGLSLVEAVSWTFVFGWALSSGVASTTLDSEALRSISTAFTWVSS